MSRRPAAIARSLLAVAAIGVMAAACETTGGYGYGAPAQPAAFSPEDFAWSTHMGRASIEGAVAYRQDGQAYSCTGSAGLTPDTPYTRARFRTLYGATDRAALPEAVVRARTVADPNADYRAFVRSVPCQNNRFVFSDLPDGGWFVIAPVSAGGERVVLMRYVQTRGGRVSLTL
ncbi:MAG: hypothetical protein EON89_04330 [Brevundimonas sp.]|nr:MAG: hypothetical protein EON89_04330 [Brevundimonas sp.]